MKEGRELEKLVREYREAIARGEELGPFARLKLRRYEDHLQNVARKAANNRTRRETGLTVALDNTLARRLDTFCEATDTREAALISALLTSFLDAWEHEEAGAACSGSALSRELLELVREEIRSMKNNTNQGG